MSRLWAGRQRAQGWGPRHVVPPAALELSSTLGRPDPARGVKGTSIAQPHHYKNQWVLGNITNLANVSVHLLGVSGVAVEYLLYTRLRKTKFLRITASANCVKTSPDHLLGGHIQCMFVLMSIIVTFCKHPLLTSQVEKWTYFEHLLCTEIILCTSEVHPLNLHTSHVCCCFKFSCLNI